MKVLKPKAIARAASQLHLTLPPSPARPTASPKKRRRRIAPPRGTVEHRVWDAAGNFLRWHAPWDLWVTLTLRHGATGRRKVVAMLHDWLDALAKQAGNRVTAGYCVEGIVTENIHVHAVVSFHETHSPVSAREADRLWRRWGHTCTRRFDFVEGACWYIAKQPDWEITYGVPSKHWPRKPVRVA